MKKLKGYKIGNYRIKGRKEGLRMNYKFYRLEKNVKKASEKLIDATLYLPKALYNKSASFKSFMTKVEEKSYIRSKKRELAKDIFYYLDKNGECAIPAKYAYIGDFYVDIVNHNIELLLKDKKWIKRNKLQVAEMTFYQYIEKYEPNCLFKVTDSQKDHKVYIITR